MDENTPAVAPEPAPTPVETAPVEEAKPEPAPAPAPEPTMAEILTPEGSPAPKLVPEAALISEKKGRKEWERKYKELEKQVAEGATRSEVADDIDSLMEQFGVDATNKQFFEGLVKIVEKKTEDKYAAQTAPQEEARRQEKIETAFSSAFKDALERNPEYNGIANPAVIKALSLLPENADKTFTEILDDTYGNSVQGRRTIEISTPGGTKEPQPIDFDRAKTDTPYFEQLMADPAKKAEYNRAMLTRGGL